MENIPHGITIESYTADTSAQAREAEGEGGVYSLHTWRDLCLIPVCRPVVQPPLEKTMTLDVEGMSGVADLSHGLTGYPIFKDREGTWQFWLDTDSYQEKINYYGPVGDRAYRELLDKLVSLMRSPYQTRIILDDDPSFYYIGRIWLDGKPTYQYDHAKFTLRYRLYPYKYMRNEYGSDWLWDTFRFTTDFADTRSTGSGMWNWDSFCFETDLATAKMKDVALKAGQTETFPLAFTDKPSAVFVTSSGVAEARLKHQNGKDAEGLVQVEAVHYMDGVSAAGKESTGLKRISLPLTTKSYYLHLMSIEIVNGFHVVGTNTVSLRLKGTGTVLARASFNEVDTGSGSGIITSTRRYCLKMEAELRPDTEYEFVLETDNTGEDGSIRVARLPKKQVTESCYVDFCHGAAENADGDYLVFDGALSFYDQHGAVLTEGARTNIGTVGRNVDDSGMTVAVTAKEDTVVNIEYCPAYL